MDVHITLARGRMATSIYDQLKRAILDGRLRPGDELPASRALASRLEVARNTVLAAYQDLTAEGFLVGKAGAGTRVSDDAARSLMSRRAPTSTAIQPQGIWRTTAVEPSASISCKYDFRLGVPDVALFPWDEWRRLVAKQFRGRRPSALYPPPEGHLGLREAIARHIGLARSVVASRDDVLVTSGAQQAFDLIAKTLVRPGMTVAVEEPGFPPAHRALRAYGARIAPVRVDAEGIVVDQLPAKTKLVYVTPSHQFPLGVPMSLARRIALLEWCAEHDAAIIEDDYDSELRYDGRPLAPLQTLDRVGRVLYVGTFSKVLMPSLRLGFLVAPASVMPALRAAKQLSDSHGPFETQAALAQLIDDGTLARHVRRITRIYGERHARLHAALARELADELDPIPSSAGLHTSAWLRRSHDVSTLARVALDAGVAVEPLATYYQRRARPGIALGYGAIATPQIDEGVRRLARALRSA